MDAVPFTERSNAITQDIDIATPPDMVELLSKTDYEIFSGITRENLFSDKVIESVTNLVNVVCSTLQESPEDVIIVLAGCGTSGRLGYLISKVCNELTQDLGLGYPFTYSIAGGDKSLLTSQEAPEDDPNEGISSLTEICGTKKKVIYVGISCGISAPFVGGQLDWCMRNLHRFTPVLLGFNHLDMARNVEIPGWNRTLRDVAHEMEVLSQQGKAIIINPILGAEAITGSSRMKGGSATKVILEAAFLTALNSLETKQDSPVSSTTVKVVLESYQDICRDFYDMAENRTVMSELIELTGSALKQNGAIHYFASGWMGVIPLIDSTECPPTFGSTVDDVRGFVLGGYDFLNIEDYGKENASFKLGIGDAVDLYKRGVANTQVITFIREMSEPLLKDLQADLGSTLKAMRGKGKTAAVVMSVAGEKHKDINCLKSCFDKVFRLQFPKIATTQFRDWGVLCSNAIRDSLHGLCLKWTVNAVSTCSHVLIGKVYKNYMCDVKVSNNKLYHRAVGIIQKMSGADYKTSRESLLKSIYGVSEVGEELKIAPVSQHYNVAAPMDKVVPLAIILAKQNCSISTARDTLQKYPIVKNAMLVMDSEQ